MENRQLISASKYVKALIFLDGKEKTLVEPISFFAELTNAVVDAPHQHKGDNYLSLEFSINQIITSNPSLSIRFPFIQVQQKKS